MKPVTLSSAHYAAKWEMSVPLQSLREMDDLGRRHAELPAEIEVGDRCVSNPAKQDLLLELCRTFISI